MLLRWFVVRVGVYVFHFARISRCCFWNIGFSWALGVKDGVGDADGTRITCGMLRNKLRSETEFGFGSRVWAFRCLMHFILTFILPQCTEQTARPQDLDRAIRHAVHTRKGHSQRSEETLGSGQYSCIQYRTTVHDAHSKFHNNFATPTWRLAGRNAQRIICIHRMARRM